MMTRKIIACVCILFWTSSSLYSEEQEYQVLTHKSEIVGGATVTLFPKTGKLTKAVTVYTDAQGYFNIPEKIDVDGYGYLTIQAEGFAFAIYLWSENKRTFKLQPDFEITGQVYQDGHPAKEAHVSLVASGIYTYIPFVLDTLNQSELFTALTDENGEFTISGVTHNEENVSNLNNVQLLASKKNDSKDWFGTTITLSASTEHIAKFKAENTAYFEKHYTDPPAAKIALYPSGTIEGTLVNAVTNTPIPGATISYFSPILYKHPIEVVTDKHGYFKFESVPAMEHYRLHIQHEFFPYEQLRVENLHPFNLQIPLNENLQIKARPSVLISGKVIDAHSGSMPLVPLDLSFEINDSIDGNWRQSLELSSGNIGSDAKVTSEGTFSIKLPTGKNKLSVSGPYNNRYKPYNQTEEIIAETSGPTELNIALHRSSGVLFQFDESTFKKLKKAGNLVVSCSQKDSETFSYADDSHLWFWPSNEWGDEIEVDLEYRLNGSKIKLLENMVFKAEPDSWPTNLDLTKALEHLNQHSLTPDEATQ